MPRIPSRTLAVVVVSYLAAAGPGVAQGLDALLGRPLVQVRAIVEGRESHDSQVARVLETRPGSALSAVAVREGIVHLMALGRFEDVRVSAEEAGDGVRLTYELVPLRTVQDLAFRGDLGVSVRQLRRAIADRHPRIPPVTRADEVARTIEAFLHGRGYLRASVRPHPEVNAASRHVTLVFDIAAGARVHVGTVTVDGAPAGDGARVQARLGLQKGAPLDRDDLDRRIAKYVADLRSGGYHDAQIEPELTYSEGFDRADVAIRMSVGPRVDIVFVGDPLTPTTRPEAERLRRDATTDQDRLEDVERRIEDGLRAQGFRDARVTFAREPRGDGREQVVFTVKRGRQYQVALVDVTGNSQVSLGAVLPAPRMVQGQWFVKSRLDLDVATMTEAYRRLGFREVRVTAAVAARAGDAALLDVRVRIVEGPRTVIGDVVFEGNTLPAATLRARVTSAHGDPFYLPAIAADRDAVLLEYLNRGYQLATVAVQPAFSADGADATLRFVVHEGPQIFADHVLVVGNVRTKVDIIEREIRLRPGMPISVVELADAQRRLSALGLFRRVEVRELQRGSETRRDVLVVVEEAPPTSIGYGGGFEVLPRLRSDESGNPVTKYEFTPRGFFEIGRRNLWGKNRSVNLFTRVAIKASDQVSGTSSGTTSPAAAAAPLTDTGGGFREYRVLGTYREPRVFGLPVDLSVNALADQAIRSSFDFNRRQVVVEGSHRFGSHVSMAGRYTLGKARIFNARIAEDEQLPVDRLFPQVRLSSFSSTLTRDTRNDLLDPSRGLLTLFDGTVASRKIGSEVGFLKGVAQVFAFRRLPALGGTVLAVGLRVGLATGLPKYVLDLDESGNPKVDANGRPIRIKVQDVPASERFFAGGDNTLRGFDLDRLGAPGVLDSNGVSKGGNALLLWNTELRFPILSSLGLGGVAFVDVGNVFGRANDIDLGQLRTGIGTGIRWKSPVGPLRIDLGWKATRHTFGNGVRESRFKPYISIGQAF